MKIELLDLRPTQFTVGLEEVRLRAAKLKKLGGEELDQAIKQRPVPVALSRGGVSHIVDRHHFARACWEAGVKKLHTELRADLSHLDEQEFWKSMAASRFAHLYDKNGKGPLDPAKLPKDVRGLADDPYRSLAWQVRREGGYDKSDQPFSDFLWAEYFRKHVKIAAGENGVKKAVPEALKLAHSAWASRLPGFSKP